jgi:hypothetical protein
MFKKLSLLMVFALVFVVGVAAVSAAAPTPTPTTPAPVFTDGRLNAYDAGAPIVIYEPQVSVPALQADGLPGAADVIGGVQILSWNGASQSSSLALNLSADAINQAIAKHPNKDFTIATQHGVSLGYSQTGYFWVTSAPDFEGKTYTFIWQKNF